MDDDGLRLISKLTGPDSGPQFNAEDVIGNRNRYEWYSIINWQKKVIQSSSHRMMVEFHSAIASQFDGFSGFSAFISYSLLEKKECIDGLDMEKGIIKSPNYPNPYVNDISCNWLITVGYGFHITLTFTDFNVGLIFKIYNPMFQSFICTYMFFPIQLEYNKDFLNIYNGSNDDTDMIAKMTGKMNESEVSIQGKHNQLLVVFTTNEDIHGNGFYGLIKQGRFFNYLTVIGKYVSLVHSSEVLKYTILHRIFELYCAMLSKPMLK